MRTSHPASATPIEYTREEIEILAGASSQIRAAAHTARVQGLAFTLDAPDTSTVELVIQDPTRPRRRLMVTMTRKTPTARPAHVVTHVMGCRQDRLQVAQIQSRIRDMIQTATGRG